DGIRDRNVTGVQTCALPICEDMAASLHVVDSYRSKEFCGVLPAKLGQARKHRRVMCVTRSMSAYDPSPSSKPPDGAQRNTSRVALMAVTLLAVFLAGALCAITVIAVALIGPHTIGLTGAEQEQNSTSQEESGGASDPTPEEDGEGAEGTETPPEHPDPPG